MEDPAERLQKRKDHIKFAERIANERLALWSQPTRTFGYWRSPEANAVYAMHVDPGHNKLPGRAKAVNY
ncbi:hypothetical protein BSKO_03832 [Bryopsis sp. KO-2023]|nr:hypothetical protein BSKO_03832 [Bryopsis sp. KO-2023]